MTDDTEVEEQAQVDEWLEDIYRSLADFDYAFLNTPDGYIMIKSVNLKEIGKNLNQVQFANKSRALEMAGYSSIILDMAPRPPEEDNEIQ